MKQEQKIIEIRKEISILESKRDKLYDQIEEKKQEIEKLKDEQKFSEYDEDWKKFEGGCFFVESYIVNGKVSNYVYKVISSTPTNLYYEYGDLEAEYVADWNKHQHPRGYNKWKKITHTEYKKLIKGFKDLRKSEGERT